MTNYDEEKAKKMFRSYIQAELSHPETRKAKKSLVGLYSRKPVVSWFPSLVPALGLAIAIAVIFPNIWPLVRQVEPPKTQVSVKEDLLTKSAGNATIPSGNVSVMNVDSKLGPTMVYQKMYQDAFLTVVWVFPRGNQA